MGRRSSAEAFQPPTPDDLYTMHGPDTNHDPPARPTSVFQKSLRRTCIWHVVRWLAMHSWMTTRIEASGVKIASRTTSDGKPACYLRIVFSSQSPWLLLRKRTLYDIDNAPFVSYSHRLLGNAFVSLSHRTKFLLHTRPLSRRSVVSHTDLAQHKARPTPAAP